jgi:hypothetical protein
MHETHTRFLTTFRGPDLVDVDFNHTIQICGKRNVEGKIGAPLSRRYRSNL